MTTERVERRLAAILAVDVAGYSRLMGADEEGTLTQLKAHRRELVDPKIAEHRGRIVKTTGDGMLVEFASTVDAVRCAVEVQRGMAERNAPVLPEKRIEFRVGVHQGDIIIDRGDIFGDGVNVAARLEGLAEPGGICVSGRVQEDARGKLDVAFEDAGEQQLKNIEHPLRVFHIKPAHAAAASRPALPLPDRPSVAVLPFQNMSGDPEQEYFADGVVEEIITALSRFRHLFVIARNSSFTYKGRAIDVKRVGRELGVRYVLEGSVRKSGNRVRITGQLIEATTGEHLWADRFDGGLDEFFDLQDAVATNVVGAIVPKVDGIERERARRKPTENLVAWDNYMRASAAFEFGGANDEALRLSYRAIELDPNYGSPYGLAASCYGHRKTTNLMTDPIWETAEAARLARAAAEFGHDDARALCSAGYVLAHVVRDLEGGAALIDRSLLLNPNLADAWEVSGWIRTWFGAPELALQHIARAVRLNPVDPRLFNRQAAMAFAHFCAGHYDEAASWVEKALRAKPNYVMALRIAAASHALAGRLDEAKRHMEHVRQRAPTLCVSNLKDWLPPFRRPEDFARYEEGLRQAGLPE